MSEKPSLLKNTAILAVGNFSSKILTFALVPLYTSALSTSEYGAYDIVYSTMTLLIPILTLNIADAMLRFPLEKGADVPRICHIGIIITLLASVFVLTASQLPFFSLGKTDGISYAAPLFLSNAIYQLLVLLARGTNRFPLIAIAGFISSAAIVVLALVLIISLDLGLEGLYLSNILGMGAGAIYLIIMFRGVIFSRHSTRERGLLLRMVRYSLPLCFTLVGWWFINTAGRYIVLAFCGIADSGLYSISGKIPAILTAITSIFLQAWQVSGIEELEEDGDPSYVKSVFFYVESAMCLLCSIAICVTPILASVLFQNDFYVAWQYVPLQLVFVVYSTMGGMWGPVFSSSYNTRPMAISTLLGGAVSLSLGVPLAKGFGVHGVVVAALLGGFVNWLWRGKKAEQVSGMNFSMGKSMCMYSLLVLQGLLLVIANNHPISLLIQIAFLIAVVILNKSAVSLLYERFKSKLYRV